MMRKYLIFTALLGISTFLSSYAQERQIIEISDSPVRILLTEKKTYQISFDGKEFSRELPQLTRIKLRYVRRQLGWDNEAPDLRET